jgi:hypothetical protein
VIGLWHNSDIIIIIVNVFTHCLASSLTHTHTQKNQHFRLRSKKATIKTKMHRICL